MNLIKRLVKMFKEFLNEESNAYYHTTTQEIRNCKKGTHAYYHEYAHYLQDVEYNIIAPISYSMQCCIWLSFLFWLMQLYLPCGICLICYVILHCIIESSAEIYAWNKCLRRKKK